MGETKIPLVSPADEDVVLRVFLDKSIIEVFVNDRLAALAPHVYAAENQGVSLFTGESSVYVKEFLAWKLRSSYGNLRNEVTQ